MCALYKKYGVEELPGALIAPDPSHYDLQCIVCIKRGSDLLVQVCVHNLSFLLLVALAHVTDIVGKFCLNTVDFELYLSLRV